LLDAGTVGYLLKEQAYEELIQAIRTVVDERMYISPDINCAVTEECTSPI
jgi:DNA-binding NarL/FixJ family response regulator